MDKENTRSGERYSETPGKIKANGVPCPKCGCASGIYSGRTIAGNVYKRGRRCNVCGHRFNTFEFVEDQVEEILKQLGYHENNGANSLCWQCKRATGFCSWSRDFKPVRGWEAEPTLINGDVKCKESKIPSYDVKKCPLFIQDRVK